MQYVIHGTKNQNDGNFKVSLKLLSECYFVLSTAVY